MTPEWFLTPPSEFLEDFLRPQLPVRDWPQDRPPSQLPTHSNLNSAIADRKPRNLPPPLIQVCGELVEKMELVDEFTNPKKGKTSHCYRVTYRSMDRSLTDEEVNQLQESLRTRATDALGIELR